MDNIRLQLKFKERLNKIDSLDYDNIEPWQIIEAFNKAQLEFVRNQVRGINIKKEGDEASKVLVDDLQKITKERLLVLNLKDRYYESDLIPDDYLYYKRVDIKASTDCCTDEHMIVYPQDTADVNQLLSDELKKPSFLWRETFFTLFANKVRVYTNNEFTIPYSKLTYYRLPTPIAILGVPDPVTNIPAVVNVTCEFKDDIVEVLIDSACKILAGDTEAVIQVQRQDANVQKNT